MGTITLGGVTYIQESVADETIPAHNYDDMIDVGGNEDLDAWIARISAEWDNIPPEIREKIVAGVEKEIGGLSGLSDDGEFFDGDIVDESQPAAEPLDEAQKDMDGNEIYDFAEGRKHARSMPNESLEYVRQDLINVITVQEQSHRQGHHTPKLGYYWDEYWTLMDEIARRMKQGQHFDLKPWSLQGNAVDDKLSQLGQ